MTEGTIAQVLAGAAVWTVQRGDSLLVLRELPDESVDLLVADPPYSSGGQFRGDRTRATGEKYVRDTTEKARPDDFAGDTRDQRAFTLWTALWCAEAHRVAKEGAVGMLFTDWRQLGATVDGFQAGGWVCRGIAPWDKTEASRPRGGGFRAQCEFIVWGTRGALVERDVFLPGCFRYPVGRDKLHQAVKPEGLLAELVRLCPAGGVVLDPFPGSGSVGVAATRAGLRYLGIEVLQSWVDVSTERLRADLESSTLQARRSGQEPLFPTSQEAGT